ncbi:hypothetical protein RMCBS344292_16000 [Rhizopus microsporus]|nr:hypothetical protein RMCBS344292_16000 [Rhizopus microsporus]
MLTIQEHAKKLQFQRPQKEFQSTLSKLGKEIDRKFKQDVSVIYHPEAFADKQDLIYRALALHFTRQGQFDLCEEFLNEAEIPIDNELRDTVEKLRNDIEQIWAEANHDELKKMQSSLEFSLHRMRFIQILLSKTPMEAIQYGRKHFGTFSEKRYHEIKRLMTAPLFVNDLLNSRYSDLCSPSNWTDIKQEFQRDFCSLLRMSIQSPLYTSVYVGTTALPVIMKLYKVMIMNKAEWSAQGELPVEIPLEEELRFHSVFACPVSKEQATDNNPPMMMPCGHVICKESLTRLARSSRSSSKFKCPYCPQESTFDQATQVYF